MILLRSLSDDITVTASSSVGSLPVAAVQRLQPRDVWRSTGNADQNIIFDFGVSTFFDTAAVLYHNASVTGNELWRVRTSLTDATVTSSLEYDSGTMQMADETRAYERYTRLHSVHEWSDSLNVARYCRLDFTQLSVLSFLEIGRIMIGLGVLDSAAFGFTIGSTIDTSAISTRGTLWRTVGRKSRTLTFNYPYLTDLQAWVYHGEIDNSLDTPILASITELHTGARQTDWTLYGYIEETSTQFLLSDLNVRSVTLEEMERP